MVHLMQNNCNQVILIVWNISIIAVVPRCFGIDGDKNVIFTVTILLAIKVSSTDCFSCSNWQNSVECIFHANEEGSASVCQVFLHAEVSESNLHKHELWGFPTLFTNGYDFSDDSLNVDVGWGVVNVTFKVGICTFSLELLCTGGGVEVVGKLGSSVGGRCGNVGLGCPGFGGD